MLPDPRQPRAFGALGYFLEPAEIIRAASALREAGYTRLDAHTPFPVHGLDKALGIRPSFMGWLVLAGGTVGLLSAIALAAYTQAYDYPLLIAGKPAFAYQAFVPIFFEVTVLFSGLTCFFGLWGVLGLPRLNHPVFEHPDFARASDDAFFLSVSAADPRYDSAETPALLARLGAREVQEVES